MTLTLILLAVVALLTVAAVRAHRPKPASPIAFSIVAVDNATRVFAAVGERAAQAARDLRQSMVDLAEQEKRDAGYGTVEIVLLVVVVVLALVGVYYLIKAN